MRLTPLINQNYDFLTMVKIIQKNKMEDNGCFKKYIAELQVHRDLP